MTVNVSTSPPLIPHTHRSFTLKVTTEVITAYLQSVLDGRGTIEGYQLRADCPFHIDNDESFIVDLRTGNYRCRCSHGSIVQFEMLRVGEDGTPGGWAEAAGRIITIANEALAKSDA